MVTDQESSVFQRPSGHAVVTDQESSVFPPDVRGFGFIAHTWRSAFIPTFQLVMLAKLSSNFEFLLTHALVALSARPCFRKKKSLRASSETRELMSMDSERLDSTHDPDVSRDGIHLVVASTVDCRLVLLHRGRRTHIHSILIKRMGNTLEL